MVCDGDDDEVAEEEEDDDDDDRRNWLIIWITVIVSIVTVKYTTRACYDLGPYHACRPSFHQLVTSAFCHLSLSHLSSNLFFVYVFGRILEEEYG